MCLMSEHFLLKALSSHRQQAKGNSGLPLVVVMVVVLEVLVGLVGVWLGVVGVSSYYL